MNVPPGRQGPEGRRWAAAAVLAAAVATGCALLTHPPAERPNVADMDALRARIAKGDAPPGAHRELAMLLVDARNPARSYQLALRELERYAAADPVGADSPEVRTWLAALRTLEELELERSVLEVRLKEAAAAAAGAGQAADKARRELQDVKRAREALSKEVAERDELLATLRRESREMKETIDKLKALDLRMDQLRRGTR
ncbi:MAG: hypothetical protein HY900_02990 [Deltaproteobacteria bacterium]|nr:hypothetical protein [Deltaproteobacteria bacterium]